MLRRTTPALFAIALGLVTGLPVVADELSLEQILDKYYEAVGGQEAWLAVDSMKQTGKMQMMGMEAPFVSYAKRPGRIRIEFQVQGMTGIQAFDGEKGWLVMPFMGSTDPEPMPQEMVEMMESDLDIEGPLMGHLDKGHEIELVGKEDFEGTESYHLKVNLKTGRSVDYFLDSDYFVPIGMKAKNTMQGQEMEATTAFSDYKEVGGLMMPHSIAVRIPMGEQVLTLQTVELGAPVDDAMFEMPAKTGATPDAK